MLHSPIRSEREILEEQVMRSALERKQDKKEQILNRVKSIFENLKHNVYDRQNKSKIDEETIDLINRSAITQEKQNEEEKEYAEMQQKERIVDPNQELDEQFMQARNLGLIDM